MSQFALTGAVIRRLFVLNSFDVPADKVVLFGLRGCLPVNEKDYSLSSARQVDTIQVDYRHPRCTIGLWRPTDDSIAVFAGSTVPYHVNVESARRRGGAGTNQVVPSYLLYTRGMHPGKVEKPQHEAFRQGMDFPIQRTGDDTIYEVTDQWQVGSDMGDNLHCGHSQGSHQPYYSSLGCQVVCGTAKRTHKPNTVDFRAWKAFRDLAFGSGQQKYRYALLTDAKPRPRPPSPSRRSRRRSIRFDRGPRRNRAGCARLGGLCDRDSARAVRPRHASRRAPIPGGSRVPPDAVVGIDTADLLGIANWPRG
jgi:hypothetical protein